MQPAVLEAFGIPVTAALDDPSAPLPPPLPLLVSLEVDGQLQLQQPPAGQQQGQGPQGQTQTYSAVLKVWRKGGKLQSIVAEVADCKELKAAVRGLTRTGLRVEQPPPGGGDGGAGRRDMVTLVLTREAHAQPRRPGGRWPAKALRGSAAAAAQRQQQQEEGLVKLPARIMDQPGVNIGCVEQVRTSGVRFD